MKVTQPLTLIRVGHPGSVPLKETWKLAMPDAAAHVHPGADRPVHQGDPADQEQEHAEVEGEAGGLGLAAAATGQA